MDERNSGSGGALGSLNRAQEGLGAGSPATGAFRVGRASRLARRLGTTAALPVPTPTRAQRGAVQANAARIDASSSTPSILYRGKPDSSPMAPAQAGMRTVTSGGQSIDRSHGVHGPALQSSHGGAAVPWQSGLAAYRFHQTVPEPAGDCPAGIPLPSHF